jgi:hypothetical protein
MEIENRKAWVIMTKCRRYIAKGTPRNRELIEVDNKRDKKRFLTYSTRSMAESAFRLNGFYTYRIKDFPYDVTHMDGRIEHLEAVECTFTLNTI